MYETSDLKVLGYRTVTKRGASLHIVLPPDVSDALQISNGDTLAFLFDPDTRDILLMKPLESKLSGPGGKLVTLDFSLKKSAKEVLTILQKSGAYLTGGHYKLASGKHSDGYIQVRYALSLNKYAKTLGQQIAKEFEFEGIDVVCAFTVGGFALAEVIHKALHVPMVLGIRDSNGRIRFSNMADIKRGDNILLVDDVLTTGTSIRKAIKELEPSQGAFKGIAVVVDRSEDSDLNVRPFSLIRIQLNQYDSKNCPLCKGGEKPVDMSSADRDLSTIFQALPTKNHSPMVRLFRRYVEKLQKLGGKP